MRMCEHMLHLQRQQRATLASLAARAAWLCRLINVLASFGTHGDAAGPAAHEMPGGERDVEMGCGDVPAAMGPVPPQVSE